MRTTLERWERASEIPLMIAAMLFLMAFAVPLIWWPNTPEPVVVVCEVRGLGHLGGLLPRLMARLAMTNQISAGVPKLIGTTYSPSRCLS